MSLDGKVIIVTGAGQGIGHHTARLLGERGAKVVVADRAVDRGEAAAAELRDSGIEATFIDVDVSDEESCRSLAERAVAAYGGLDALVNNAGISSDIEIKPFWELSQAEWDGLMDVNLKGVWMMTKACRDALTESRGAVVNIASGVVIVAPGGYTHYVASKAGVAGMTRAMAREIGPFGVRVNSVSPGPVDTGMERTGWKPSDQEVFIERQCLKRAAEPLDIAKAVAFFASSDSSFVTGQMLVVDGGLMFH